MGMGGMLGAAALRQSTLARERDDLDGRNA